MSVTNLNSLVQEMVNELIKKILRSPNFDYTRDLYDINALMPRGVSDLNVVFDNFQKIRGPSFQNLTCDTSKRPVEFLSTHCDVFQRISSSTRRRIQMFCFFVKVFLHYRARN